MIISGDNQLSTNLEIFVRGYKPIIDYLKLIIDYLKLIIDYLA